MKYNIFFLLYILEKKKRKNGIQTKRKEEEEKWEYSNKMYNNPKRIVLKKN